MRLIKATITHTIAIANTLIVYQPLSRDSIYNTFSTQVRRLHATNNLDPLIQDLLKDWKIIENALESEIRGTTP